MKLKIFIRAKIRKLFVSCFFLWVGRFGSFDFAPAVGFCGWGQRQMCQIAVAKEIFKNAKRGLFFFLFCPRVRLNCCQVTCGTVPACLAVCPQVFLLQLVSGCYGNVYGELSSFSIGHNVPRACEVRD